MPIVDIENSKQLEFGYGDIEVAPGLLKSEDNVGIVCFFQREESNTIGAHTQYDQPQEASVINTPVRMLFDKIESIDVVIWALEEAKKFMINKKV